MKHLRSILAVSLIAVSVAGTAMAQSLSYNVYMTADHNMRTSKLIGLPIYNEKNEKIGTIDDVLLPVAGGEVSAVLSVGGYVGGDKMVKVPLSHVHLTSDKPMMEGDKSALMAMPKYSYVPQGGG